MATVLPEDEKAPQGPQGGAPANQMGGGSPGAPAPVGGGSPPSAQMAAQNGPSSSGFTNIQKYLQANKSYDQGGGLAGQIGSNISNQASQLGSSVSDTAKAFQTQADQSKSGWSAPSGFAQQALADPSKFAADQANVDKFRQMATAQYGGPQSLSDVQGGAGLQAQAANLGQEAQGTRTEAGRFGLLGQMFGRPSYSYGQQNFDNLLLNSAPNQSAILKGAYNSVSPIQQQLQQAQQNATGTAAQYGADARNTAAATNAALTGAEGNAEYALRSKLREAKSNQDIDFDRLNTGIGKRALSAQDMAQLGIQPGQATYGLDVNSYLGKAAAPTLQNIASSQDYAKFGALAKLAGQNDSSFLSNNDVGQAGGFTRNGAVNFDLNRFNNDIASQKSAYESELNPLSAKLGQAANQLALDQSQVNKGDYQDAGRDFGDLLLAGATGGLSLAANAARGDSYKNEVDRRKAAALQDQGTISQTNAALEALKSKYGIGNVLNQV